MGPFIGKYRGVVTDIEDPEMRGRICASVPDVFGDEDSGWALPCLPMAGSSAGICALPPVGAWVWIEFEQGDPMFPIWSGGFWNLPTEVPDTALIAPYMKTLFKTPGGSTFLLDDTPGVAGITLKTAAGDQLVMGPLGVTLQSAAGDKLTMDATGITLQSAAGQKLVLGAMVELSNSACKIEISTAQVQINGSNLVVLP